MGVDRRDPPAWRDRGRSTRRRGRAAHAPLTGADAAEVASRRTGAKEHPHGSRPGGTGVPRGSARCGSACGGGHGV